MTVVDRIEGMQRWADESLAHFLWRVAERNGRHTLEPPLTDEQPGREEPGIEG